MNKFTLAATSFFALAAVAAYADDVKPVDSVAAAVAPQAAVTTSVTTSTPVATPSTTTPSVSTDSSSTSPTPDKK